MIGKTILNYRIVSLIGSGGMGSVYLAEHTMIREQKVAIKVIRADMVNDFTREMIKQEATRLAELHHPNIVSFINYHFDEEGNIFLVMEHAQGIGLDRYIRDVNGLVVEDRIDAIFDPILDAVGYAHSKGILHRDIKPANIIIGDDGQPKVLDFGIATLMNDESQVGVIAGTPSYMSPEQAKGERLDARSDIYSLGVLLHHMLTGKAPYDTSSLSGRQILDKVAQEPLPRMKSYYKHVSDAAQRVVDKATAKDPRLRYANTDEMKKDLRRATHPWRMPLWGKCAIAAGVLLAAAGAYWAWDYNRVKTEYYKDYAEQWGVPQGIGKLSGSQRAHARASFKFTKQRGRLLSVEHVNSLGRTIDDNSILGRPAEQHFSYTDKGQVSRVKVKDAMGKTLYVKSYNDKLNTMVYQYDDEYGTERRLPGSAATGDVIADATANLGSISRWLIERDANGYVIETKFADYNNSPVADENGIYGITYQRDEKGRPTHLSYIGIDGQAQPTRWGLCQTRYAYDDADNLALVSYHAADGSPATDTADGVPAMSMAYDKYGNVIEKMCCDHDGNYVTASGIEASGQRFVYDEKGMPIQIVYLDEEKQPMFVPSIGCAIINSEFDYNGYLVCESYHDLDGTPVDAAMGYGSVLTYRDEKGNPTRQWTYDCHGNLAAIDGIAGYWYLYDDRGNTISIEYYDDQEQRAAGTSDYAAVELEWNDRDQLTCLTFLNEDLLPVSNAQGVACIRYEYDKHGNRSRVAYYDTDKASRAMSTEGYSYCEYDYDDNSHLVEQRCYGTDRRLSMTKAGMAKVVNKYDEHGNQISTMYYDENGALVEVDGVAGSRQRCDRSGRVIQELFIGKDGRPSSKHLAYKYEYDQLGNMASKSLYDYDGKPAANSQGIHRYDFTYNSRNQMVREELKGVDGKPLSGPGSVPVIEKQYDKLGRETCTFNKDGNGKLKAGEKGWAVSRTSYDKLGRITSRSYFDTADNPVITVDGYHKTRRSYDDLGRVTSDAYFGTASQPINVYGVHKIEYGYEGKTSDLVSITYSDAAGKAILSRHWDGSGWAE